MTSPHPARILGVHESKPAGHRFPGAPWGREFVAGPNGTPLPESTTEKQLIEKVERRRAPHLKAGGDAMVSIKLPLRSVLRGHFDSRLQALGESLGDSSYADRPELIINHEPENDADDIPASVFVSGFNRGRDNLRKYAKGKLKVSYAGMAYQWAAPARPSTRRGKAWLGDLHADRYLADVYFGKSFSQGLTLASHPGLTRFAEHVLAFHPDARMGLAEYGRLADRKRAAMFAADFAWLQGSDSPFAVRLAEVVLVWNTAGTEGNSGWLLDDAAEMAVRAGLAGLAAGR